MNLLVLPLAIGWFGALSLAMLDGRRSRVGWYAALLLTAITAANGWLAWKVYTDGPLQQVAGNWDAGVGIVLHADELGTLFALVSSFVLLVSLVFEVLGGVRSRSFPALVLFLGTGLTGLFITGDAFNFYVFFEIAMISAYILSSYGEGRRQLRASVNFVVVNLLGSVFFLIGIAGLYHITGRLDMFGIAQRMAGVKETPAILTAALIFVAFSIKLGLFPFHFWLPAVYTGVRPAVAAILSGALANIGTYGLLRFGGLMLPRELAYGASALLVIGSVSIFYGGIQAVGRRSINEVLAYSAIGQVGYVLLALAIGGEAGFAAAIAFAVANALAKPLLFLCEPMRGWLVGGAFLVGAFSVIGLPPVAGFVGKISLIQAGTAGDDWTSVALVVVGTALSTLYMAQIVHRRYWMADPDADASNPARYQLLSRRLLVTGIAVLLLAIGAWPEPLLRVAHEAAAVLAPVVTEAGR